MRKKPELQKGFSREEIGKERIKKKLREGKERRWLLKRKRKEGKKISLLLQIWLEFEKEKVEEEQNFRNFNKQILEM